MLVSGSVIYATVYFNAENEYTYLLISPSPSILMRCHFYFSSPIVIRSFLAFHFIKLLFFFFFFFKKFYYFYSVILQCMLLCLLFLPILSSSYSCLRLLIHAQSPTLEHVSLEKAASFASVFVLCVRPHLHSLESGYQVLFLLSYTCTFSLTTTLVPISRSLPLNHSSLVSLS